MVAIQTSVLAGTIIGGIRSASFIPRLLRSQLAVRSSDSASNVAGSIRWSNLMKGKEVAGNVLMGTIGGEGSLSQIPILVLQVFYPIINVPNYFHSLVPMYIHPLLY
uniref:Uncharacterized protein n=1 Tax=Salix viminalis TaxID=40686 RepID=A0A6N2NHG8_SALVM